jgi:hypothetical protein
VKELIFIGTQIENEYMHSAAPWEVTTGINNEWLFGGAAYLLTETVMQYYHLTSIWRGRFLNIQQKTRNL